jgi:hypothetical protein
MTQITIKKDEDKGPVEYDVPEGNTFSMDEKGTVKIAAPKQRKPKVIKEPGTDVNKTNSDQMQETMLQELKGINQKLAILIIQQQNNPGTINNYYTNNTYVEDAISSMRNVTERLSQILPPEDEYLG